MEYGYLRRSTTCSQTLAFCFMIIFSRTTDSIVGDRFYSNLGAAEVTEFSIFTPMDRVELICIETTYFHSILPSIAWVWLFHQAYEIDSKICQSQIYHWVNTKLHRMVSKWWRKIDTVIAVLSFFHSKFLKYLYSRCTYAQFNLMTKWRQWSSKLTICELVTTTAHCYTVYKLCYEPTVSNSTSISEFGRSNALSHSQYYRNVDERSIRILSKPITPSHSKLSEFSKSPRKPSESATRGVYRNS